MVLVAQLGKYMPVNLWLLANSTPTGIPIWGAVKEETLCSVNSSMMFHFNYETARLWKAWL